MLLDHAINFVLWQESEYLNPFFRICISRIKPELVELIGCCSFCIQPYITGFGFAKLPSISFSDQWAGQGKCFAPCFAAYEFSARSYVTPLVAATHLEFAILVVEQPE